MLFRFLLSSLIVLSALALSGAALAQIEPEDSSPLPVGFQATGGAECLINNNEGVSKTVTMSLVRGDGTVAKTAMVTVPNDNVGRLKASLAELGIGSSVFCKVSEDIGEITLCLLRGLFDAFTCVTDD